jgi:hypothetical protein
MHGLHCCCNVTWAWGRSGCRQGRRQGACTTACILQCWCSSHQHRTRCPKRLHQQINACLACTVAMARCDSCDHKKQCMHHSLHFDSCTQLLLEVVAMYEAHMQEHESTCHMNMVKPPHLPAHLLLARRQQRLADQV